MIRQTALAVLLLLPCLASAQIHTFRKEVKQVIGSAQSQDDARAAAVARAKRDALEEAGIWLESQTEVKNMSLTKDVVTAIASGITQSRILEEQPFIEGNVIGLRVVAEVRVDNSGLQDRVRQFLADRQRLDQEKAANAREVDLLAKLADLERRMAEMKARDEPTAGLRDEVQANARQLTAKDWFDLGQALWNGTRYTDPYQAIAYFSMALRLDPNYAYAYNNRGGAYQNLGQFQRAIQDHDQALKLDPSYLYAYNNRGHAYLNLGQLQRAIQDFDQSLRLDPSYASAYNNRGNAYQGLGQYQRAIQDYDQALKLDPNYAAAYNNRGNTYGHLKQYKQTIQDYDQALRLEPDNAAMLNNRGTVYGNLGQHKRAIQDYDHALRLDPNSAVAYFNRANTHSTLGQHKQAIQDFDQALRLDPTNGSAHQLRGNAYAALEQRPRAYVDWRKACELGKSTVCDWLRKNPESAGR